MRFSRCVCSSDSRLCTRLSISAAWLIGDGCGFTYCGKFYFKAENIGGGKKIELYLSAAFGSGVTGEVWRSAICIHQIFGC